MNRLLFLTPIIPYKLFVHFQDCDKGYKRGLALPVLYQYIQPILQRYCDPEKCHDIAVKILSLPYIVRKCLGLVAEEQYKNKVGIAAGFDKDGRCVQGLYDLGFGNVEIGTVVPFPQYGNMKPRLFHYGHGILNRYGFNSVGIDNVINNIKNNNNEGYTGINIGMNKNGSINDYSFCCNKLKYVKYDYITLNVSSPNTVGLRNLQHNIDTILNTINNKNVYVKLSPDLTLDQLTNIINLSKNKVEGYIISNTMMYNNGGYSGPELNEKSNEFIRHVKMVSPNSKIIGVGGIFSGSDALEKIKCGADKVQIYTSFIKRGPLIITEINRMLN